MVEQGLQVIAEGVSIPSQVQSRAVFGSATYRNASVYLLEDPSFTLSVHRQTDSQGHLKIPAGGRYVVGVVVSDGRVGLISDGRWEKDVWEVSPLPKALRAKPVAAGDLRGDIDDDDDVDWLDLALLGAYVHTEKTPTENPYGISGN